MTATETALLRRIQSRVLENRLLAETFFLLRLHTPDLPQAHPGQFVQLTCGPDLILPRPFSILDSHASDDSIDIFYRVVGQGTQRMATWKKNHMVSLLGPIGKTFTPPPPTSHALLVAGGVGLAPLDFFARQLVQQGINTTLLWGIESDPPLPVQADPAQSGLPEGLALSHLSARGISSRLTSLTKRPGFFHGYVTDLTIRYLEQLSSEAQANTILYTCGPMPMMVALASVANRFGLRGEASLEARMACGFGVCVGCVAPMRNHDTWHYRRVCIDGPVFPLAEVDWERLG